MTPNNIIENLQQTLQEYQQLLSEPDIRERTMQLYLEGHIVLLDPSAKRVQPQVSLGTEYRADFVIETYDGVYKLVEIEKPTDRLYLKNGDPSSALTHAEQQVLNWQRWIRQNIAYIRFESQLPMNDPEGLVIIGLRSQMSQEEIHRLEERNISRRGRIKIITFDDLSLQLNQLIENIAENN
ncbi:DUF4263 domain-containing protein [bacterium]|nr:DUF4263 domain-containing protein [bacterium]